MLEAVRGEEERAGLGDGNWGMQVGVPVTPSWREVDRALRVCAKRRAAIDAEEARWLVHADRLAIHRELGCASISEYMERVLGYGPRVARERLRVARALAQLPAMEKALARGELCHSAVRELTRVATPATEVAWIEAARGRSLREVEDAVAGRQRGDAPDDPGDAEPRPITIELEVMPATLALYREALRRLEDELGEGLTDDQALALMCRAVVERESVVVDGAGADAESSEAEAAVEDGDGTTHVGHEQATPRTRNAPPYQIAVTVCDVCRRGWADVSGRSAPLGAAEVEHAWCDAHVVGRVDGERPELLTRSIPAAVRRQVFRRERGRCVVPGCRSSRHLEVHHVVPWSEGGTHEPRHLALCCAGHHRSIHAGLIEVSGEAPTFVVRRIGLERWSMT